MTIPRSRKIDLLSCHGSPFQELWLSSPTLQLALLAKKDVFAEPGAASTLGLMNNMFILFVFSPDLSGKWCFREKPGFLDENADIATCEIRNYVFSTAPAFLWCSGSQGGSSFYSF